LRRFAVTAHTSEQHCGFGSVLPPKNRLLPLGGNLPPFGNHWANALSRVCFASTTKHYDKTVVLWRNTTVRHCVRTRTLACHVYETPSFSRCKKG